MNRNKNSFIELCLCGEEHPENLNLYIKKWENSSSKDDLYVYLGFNNKKDCFEYTSDPIKLFNYLNNLKNNNKKNNDDIINNIEDDKDPIEILQNFFKMKEPKIEIIDANSIDGISKLLHYLRDDKKYIKELLLSIDSEKKYLLDLFYDLKIEESELLDRLKKINEENNGNET